LKARIESQQPEVEAGGIERIRVLYRGNREGLGSELERVGHSALALSIKPQEDFQQYRRCSGDPARSFPPWRTSTGVPPLIGRRRRIFTTNLSLPNLRQQRPVSEAKD